MIIIIIKIILLIAKTKARYCSFQNLHLYLCIVKNKKQLKRNENFAKISEYLVKAWQNTLPFIMIDAGGGGSIQFFNNHFNLLPSAHSIFTTFLFPPKHHLRSSLRNSSLVLVRILVIFNILMPTNWTFLKILQQHKNFAIASHTPPINLKKTIIWVQALPHRNWKTVVSCLTLQGIWSISFPSLPHD